MTGFLTNLTLLTFLTFLTFLTVRYVRFSDKSDCAYGEKINFLSLSISPGACLLRARKQICQKTLTRIQRAPTALEREAA